jgi:hypothetical protein
MGYGSLNKLHVLEGSLANNFRVPRHLCQAEKETKRVKFYLSWCVKNFPEVR